MEQVNIIESIPYFLKMPSKRTWIDYDDEADVLYLSFRKPQQANDSVMEDDIIYPMTRFLLALQYCMQKKGFE